MYGDCKTKEEYCKSIGCSVANHDKYMSEQWDAFMNMLRGIIDFSSAVNSSADGNKLIPIAIDHAEKLHPVLFQWIKLENEKKEG